MAASLGELVKSEPIDVCVMTADDIRAQRRAEQTVVTAQGKSIIQPIRRIRDAYPSFAAVAVDMTRDEVVLTDENLFQVLVYDRTENTPAGVAASKPKRVIAGEKHEHRIPVRRLRRPEDRRHLRGEQRHTRHAGRLQAGLVGRRRARSARWQRRTARSASSSTRCTASCS